jgi:hypothetical protein
MVKPKKLICTVNPFELTTKSPDCGIPPQTHMPSYLKTLHQTVYQFTGNRVRILLNLRFYSYTFFRRTQLSIFISFRKCSKSIFTKKRNCNAKNHLVPVSTE